MAVVLAGPYNSRSYLVGRHVLIKAHTRCPTFTYRLIPMELKRWRSCVLCPGWTATASQTAIPLLPNIHVAVRLGDKAHEKLIFNLHMRIDFLRPILRENWLVKTCREEKWSFNEVKKYKVLSWLEQGYTGVATLLLGDLSPLLEYLYDRHGVSRSLTATEMDELIEEIEEEWREKEEEAKKSRGLVITIVGAGSNEAINFLLYALMTVKTPALKTGIKVRLFEARDDRESQLLENYKKMSVVETGINIILIQELGDVFENCDLIIFLGDKFRKPGMDIEEFLHLEKVLYSTYGFLCNLFMEKQTKVMFGCMENSCFNAQCFLAEAPDLDKKRVVACTSYLGTELKSYISKIGRFPVDRIEDIPVWGMADTTHLVDVDMGCFLFKVPDSNSNITETNSPAGLVHKERMNLELYQRWELMEKARVANWRYTKLKEKLKEEEYMSKILEEGINTVEIRNERVYMLNMLIEQMKGTQKISRKVPYWEPWETLMASVRKKDIIYTYENMLQRFKKSFYNVLQHYKYIEKEAMKKKMKIEKLDNEKTRDYFDPMKTGTIDLNAVQKILVEELRKDNVKSEEVEEELLFEEIKLIEGANEIKILRTELYERCKILYEIVCLYLKRQMEREIGRLEHKLKRQNEEEMDEEEAFEEPDLKRERLLDGGPINWVDTWEGEHEQEPETTKDELNEMIEQYFNLKMELEQKIREFQGGEPSQSQGSTDDVNVFDKMDDYEIRDLSIFTKNMRYLWDFLGVCKYAVRKKIGQDPYIAQVTELIKVMKIWFLDPYMKNETVFLGIVSDSEEYPFLTDTIISQPAFCDEDMRWHPQKDFNFLWPLNIQKKIFDDPEAPVPVIRQPKEGDPFTITYAMVTALRCLMHFEIPLETHYKLSRESQEHNSQNDETQMSNFFASEQEEEKESEKDSSMSTRIKLNIESDFFPRNLTEISSSETNINSTFGLQFFKKAIHDKHDVPVGFPLDTKGRSELDLKKELDKLDFGKVLYSTTDPMGSHKESVFAVVEYFDDAGFQYNSDSSRSVRESGDFLQLDLRVRSTLLRQEKVRESLLEEEEQESLIFKVPLMPEDDTVNEDNEELFEPYYKPPKSDTISSKMTLSDKIEIKTDSEEFAWKPKRRTRVNLLKRISKFLKHPNFKKTSAIPDCYMDRSQKIVVMKRKDINFECDWLRNMATKFVVPEKAHEIEKCSLLVSENMRYMEKVSRTDLCLLEREWYGEEALEEEMSQEIWKEESVKTQVGVSGTEDVDWEEGRLTSLSRIDVENHRSWIIKMIQTIISVDKMRTMKKYMKESDSSLENTRTEGSREIVSQADMEIEHKRQEDMEEADTFSFEEQVQTEDDESNDYDNDDVN